MFSLKIIIFRLIHSDLDDTSIISNGFLILSKNIHMQSNVLIFIGMSTTVGTSKGWGKW